MTMTKTLLTKYRVAYAFVACLDVTPIAKDMPAPTVPGVNWFIPRLVGSLNSVVSLWCYYAIYYIDI